MRDVILKRFESPDQMRLMEKGRFEIVRLGGMTVGCATYEPGWKWSVQVGPGLGRTRCCLEHVGLVLSGATRRLPFLASQAEGTPAAYPCRLMNLPIEERIQASR